MDGAPDSPEARQARKQHIAKRKRELEDELQVIHSQRQRIEHHLQSLTAAPGLAAGPSKARGPSKASQPLIFGGGPAERQHIETEREKRITGLFAQCITILRNVKTNQKAGSFIEPVDPVKLKIFDYFDFVKTPMALNDVQGKLAHAPAKGIFRKYKSVLEFRDDMRQIWENCRIYNPIGQPVRTNGDHLSDFWEKKWQQSQLEQKWEAEMLLQKQEELRLAGGPELPKQMAEMDRELRALQQQVERHDGEAAAPGGRPMAFEEKRRLSQGLGSLAGDKLGVVMEIIAESQHFESDEEVEVNIDDLSQETLWKLYSFVNDGATDALPDAANASARDKGNATDQAHTAEHNNVGNHHNSAERARTDSLANSGAAAISGEGSDSHGEVGSKQLGASAVNQTRGNDPSNPMDFVSTTVQKGQPQIVKGFANRKEVRLENAGAWADLAEDDGEGEKPKQNGEGHAGDDEDEDGGDEEKGDDLWEQFQSREEQQQQQEQQKKEEEERKRKEQEAAEEAARKEQEARRLAAEAVKEAERKAAEQKEAEERQRIEEQKSKELAQIQGHKPNDADARDEQELFGAAGGGNALGDEFGLQLQDDDEEGGGGFDDDDEDDDMDAEEGEV
ncbi:g5360 [Coccomyxa viridis]|uniref:G5360 protein n=1 Tax=Coccomyxa viridis TaxID=1274662 RepID=A0ABP1FU07_9CHLO